MRAVGAVGGDRHHWRNCEKELDTADIDRGGSHERMSHISVFLLKTFCC